MKIKLGISTCPNDTFMFHAILARKIDLRGLDFEIELMDVQQLNERLEAGTFDCSKASYHAALLLADRYGVLTAGSAIGFGAGPVLLTAQEGAEPRPDSRVLCPGKWTTATLLFQNLYPESRKIEHRVFSAIMAALRDGEADFGVLIHEGRFTYQAEGLSLVADLGEAWERVTGSPVPLGGILARLDLPESVHHNLNAVIRDSLDYAYAHRQEVLGTILRYAQELDEALIWDYIDLYVNVYSRDLGDEGRRAVENLEHYARRAGVIAPDAAPVRFLD